MYAIVETGGKQYQASEGLKLIVDLLVGEPGASIELEKVLAIASEKGVAVGSPYVKGASVTVEILRHSKGPKINAFNYKAKKNERKHWGHREPQTELKVVKVTAGGKK